MAGSILLIIALSLFGLAVAFFYMKKVTSIPIDLGLNPEESGNLPGSEQSLSVVVHDYSPSIPVPVVPKCADKHGFPS